MKHSPGVYCAFFSLGSAGLALRRNFIMKIFLSLIGFATNGFAITLDFVSDADVCAKDRQE
jgi:hypothetical protein